MGLIQNGEWVDQWYDTKASGGAFKRQDSRFRDQFGEGTALPAESGRYHLYVSLACPWAHRTLIFRSLKQLDRHISVSVVEPLMLSKGWQLTEDSMNYGKQYLYEIYLKADPSYEGRVTVPVLWDKAQETIVNNESSEIIRLFNSAFNALTGDTSDYYPAHLREEIDEVNERVYHEINNGVYKAGFATEQAVYEDEFNRVFHALDWVERRLEQHHFLVGDQLTEADWRLWTTLIRFDPVYHGHFKLNRQQLKELPAISAYVQRLYQYPGIAQTTNFDHIKRHYYGSHDTINPTGIVPMGPAGNGVV